MIKLCLGIRLGQALAVSVESCTEIKGFLSINLADQASGQGFETGPKGFPTQRQCCSQSAAAVHAVPGSAPSHRLSRTDSVGTESAFFKSNKTTQSSSFSVGINLLGARDVC